MGCFYGIFAFGLTLVFFPWKMPLVFWGLGCISRFLWRNTDELVGYGFTRLGWRKAPQVTKELVTGIWGWPGWPSKAGFGRRFYEVSQTTILKLHWKVSETAFSFGVSSIQNFGPIPCFCWYHCFGLIDQVVCPPYALCKHFVSLLLVLFPFVFPVVSILIPFLVSELWRPNEQGWSQSLNTCFERLSSQFTSGIPVVSYDTIIINVSIIIDVFAVV